MSSHGAMMINKEEMERGLKAGKTLTQEEWAHPSEIKWVNELVAEGKATATRFAYNANFQCAVRTVRGVER
jgi:hypothetical protein